MGISFRRGEVLATLLNGSWRRNCQPAIISQADLERVLPLVLQSGTAGLVWRRLRGSGLEDSLPGQLIHEARVAMAAVVAMRSEQLDRLIERCEQGPEQLLLKGWAHGRLYPDPGLRTYGDFDLFNASSPPLTEEDAIPIDEHHSLADLPDRTWDQIWERSLPGPSGSLKLRVLSPEDDLRLSCLHLLRHAIEMPPRTNPLWLCDLAVMIERLPPDFDWAYCLTGQVARTQWLLAVLRLANELLGARLDRCPSRAVPTSVPAWLTRIFLRLWGRGERTFYSLAFPLPFAHVRRNIRALPRALAERWPSPLAGVYRLSWPINRVSGPAAQFIDYARKALTWVPRQVA